MARKKDPSSYIELSRAESKKISKRLGLPAHEPIAGIEFPRARMRSIETFNKKVDVGLDLAQLLDFAPPTVSKKRVVEIVARRHGVSEDYIWRTAKVGREIRRLIGAIIDKSPGTRAEVFLRTMLLPGPLPRREVIAAGQEGGIKKRTLERAYRQLGDRRRSRIWQLSEETKKHLRRKA